MTERYQLLQRRLLENPEQFQARGGGNALLKEHFDGAPLDLLRPLLRHSNVSVRGTAMFVANELGVTATELIEDVIPLVNDSDARTQYDALECVTLCSDGQHADKFIYVLRKLENSNPLICSETMRLVSKASPSQIEAGVQLVDKLQPNRAAHERGLIVLANWTEVSRVEIIGLLNDSDDVIKKYGAIIAKRRIDQSPELIQHAAKSGNEVVSRFAREAIEQTSR